MSKEILDTSAASAQLSQLESSYASGRDLANQILGRTQTAQAIGQFSLTVGILELKKLKETKGYRDLKGSKTPDGRQFFDGTWEGFCKHALHRSASSVDEEITNLNAFGERTLEFMGLAGVGIRQIRTLRKLPDDEKAALIEVAKTNDKDSFIELAEDIISKHAKEKEVLEKERDEATKNYEAQNKVLASTREQLNEAEIKAAKATQRLKDATPDDTLTAFKTEVSARFIDTASRIESDLVPAIEQLFDYGVVQQVDVTSWMYEQVKNIELQLSAICDKYALQPDFTLDQEMDGE